MWNDSLSWNAAVWLVLCNPQTVNTATNRHVVKIVLHKRIPVQNQIWRLSGVLKRFSPRTGTAGSYWWVNSEGLTLSPTGWSIAEFWLLLAWVLALGFRRTPIYGTQSTAVTDSLLNFHTSHAINGHATLIASWVCSLTEFGKSRFRSLRPRFKVIAPILCSQEINFAGFVLLRASILKLKHHSCEQHEFSSLRA